MVHVTSATAYPLFPWIRSRVADVTNVAAARWATGTAVVLGLIAVPAVVVEALGGTYREPGWPFADPASREFDRRFMEQIVVHHEAGIQMARLAVDNDIEPETATLARLVIAEQTREVALLRNWWQSWFDGLLSASSPYEPGISGMPSNQDLQRLRTSSAEETERAFLTLMREHHRRAVQMTDEARPRAGDPRLRTFAHSVRHAQLGQIRWMTALMTIDSPRLPRRPSVVR